MVLAVGLHVPAHAVATHPHRAVHRPLVDRGDPGGAVVRPQRATTQTAASTPTPAGARVRGRAAHFFRSPSAPVDSAAMKASCGTSTRPIVFIRFLPSFCFSSSLRLRVMSPP